MTDVPAPSRAAPLSTSQPGRGYTIRTGTRTSMVGAVLAVIIVLALLVAPGLISRGLLEQLVLLFVMIGLAQCWNLLAGYAGLISVGQQAFVGIGAYTLFACIITLGLDPLLAVVLAAIAGAVLSIPIGWVVFRLQGAYFAVVTWVVSEVVRLFAAKWQALGGGTGRNLPPAAKRGMFGVEWTSDFFDRTADFFNNVRGWVGLPPRGAFRSADAQAIIIYWAALVACVIIVGGVYYMLRKRVGLGLSAVKDGEIAAESVGVDLRRTKFSAFVFAGFGAALVGSIYFLLTGTISPSAAFDLQRWTAFVIFIVVIGGLGTIEGPILGAILYIVLQGYFSNFSTWYLMGLGAFAIVVMLFAPKGLWARSPTGSTSRCSPRGAG